MYSAKPHNSEEASETPNVTTLTGGAVVGNISKKISFHRVIYSFLRRIDRRQAV